MISLVIQRAVWCCFSASFKLTDNGSERLSHVAGKLIVINE